VKHVIYAYTDIPTYIYGGINIKKPNYLKNHFKFQFWFYKMLNVSPKTF